MQQESLHGTRFAVIAALQANLVHRSSGILTERSPGSSGSALLEKALDYALSPARDQGVAAFLEHEVRRDAQIAVRRTADAEGLAMADIAAICAPLNQAFTGRVDTNSRSAATEERPKRLPTVHTCGPAGKVAGMAIVSVITPEDAAVASDMERRLHSRALAELGSSAVGVLDGMLADETIAESARRLNVTTRTVDRYRAKIRLIASVIWNLDEAAA